MTKKVITYGTFDLFHIGHLNLLKRVKLMGDELIVGVSTDEFNKKKGKDTIINYCDRAEIVRSIRYVDIVIPEDSWEQKLRDIRKYEISVFAIGSDWDGKFNYLSDFCEVRYVPRTENISTTKIKSNLGVLKKDMEGLRESAEFAVSVINKLS